MVRKKVETDEIKSTTPKKRVAKKSPIKKTNKNTPVRWDKIEGVSGKIVRHSLDEKDKSKEIAELVSKKKAKRLYCAVDGDQFYIYYELL